MKREDLTNMKRDAKVNAKVNEGKDEKKEKKVSVTDLVKNMISGYDGLPEEVKAKLLGDITNLVNKTSTSNRKKLESDIYEILKNSDKVNGISDNEVFDIIRNMDDYKDIHNYKLAVRVYKVLQPAVFRDNSWPIGIKDETGNFIFTEETKEEKK